EELDLAGGHVTTRLSVVWMGTLKAGGTYLRASLLPEAAARMRHRQPGMLPGNRRRLVRMSGHAPTAGSSPDLTEAVRTWDDARLDQLLRRRPDLATPRPSSLTALASRAGARASVSRALANLDAPTLTTLEAIVVLAETRAPTRRQLDSAVGQDTGEQTADLAALALVLPSGDRLVPVPALRES